MLVDSVNEIVIPGRTRQRANPESRSTARLIDVAGFRVRALRARPGMTVWPLLAAALIFTLALPARAAEVQVTIDNFTFSPQRLTVKAGTTVTWTNRDDIPHIVAAPPKFKSKALDTDDKYSFTFATPGTYGYFCSLHPHMTGSIVVEAATGSSAPP
jgi:plastocyanin